MMNNESMIEIPPELLNLLRRYHDTIVPDNSLSNVEVLLLCIYLLENKQKKTGVDYAECRDLFASMGRKKSSFGKALHDASKQKLIEKRGLENGSQILSFSNKGLEKIESMANSVGNSDTFIIKSGQFFTAIKKFEEFLTKKIDCREILLCDPYVSPSTLHPFSVLKGIVNAIKIITCHFDDHEKIKDYIKKLNKEAGITIEIRSCKGIHDRWIICGDNSWSIGSSIKDLGNKDTIVAPIRGVTDSLRDLFQLRWNGASPI